MYGGQAKGYLKISRTPYMVTRVSRTPEDFPWTVPGMRPSRIWKPTLPDKIKGYPSRGRTRACRWLSETARPTLALTELRCGRLRCHPWSLIGRTYSTRNGQQNLVKHCSKIMIGLKMKIKCRKLDGWTRPGTRIAGMDTPAPLRRRKERIW